MTTFVVLIPKTYILGHVITLYCPCTLCARNIACTERERAMVGTQTPIHICFWSQCYECSPLALFWKRLETIFEKNILFTQGSPICPMSLGPPYEQGHDGPCADIVSNLHCWRRLLTMPAHGPELLLG